MKNEALDRKLIEVCRHFLIPGEYRCCEEIKVGNVNKTYKVTFSNQGATQDYMVQSVNTFAFKNPVQVMENIDKVTEYIRAKAGSTVCFFCYRFS